MFNWIFYAVITALLAGIAALVQKRTLFKEHAMEYVTVFSLFAAVITLPGLFIYDLSVLNSATLGMLFLLAIMQAAAFLLITKGIRHLPISLASPFLVFLPGVSAVMAYVFLDETLSSVQIAGIGVIIFGAYLLEAHKGERWYMPMVHAVRHRHMKYVFGAVLMYSIVGVIDRKILSPPSIGGMGIEPGLYLAIIHLIIAAIYVVMLTFFYEGWSDIKHGIKDAGPSIFLVALLAVGYRFSGSIAVSFAAGKIALFLGIKRMSALFSTVIGGGLFHEENLKRRALGCSVMVIGAILILI